MDVYFSCYYNTSLPKIIPATLQIKDNISVFEEHFDKSKEWDNGKDIFEDLNLNHIEHIKRNGKNKLNGFIKRDVTKKDIILIDFIGKKEYLIQDNYIEIKWNILSETKIISNFTCHKAEAVFRGLKWTAWFTSEIPVSFGPWKLYGLPGLILEAYDENEKYRFVAEKVTINSSSKLFFPSENLSITTIKEAAQEQIKRREAINGYISRGEVNLSDKYKVETMEPIYEWEEEAKK